MAQQTQIERVGPKWAVFLAAFPTFEALAAATPADVIRAWAGLGYNRRALSLWRCARLVVKNHGGRLPSDLDALTALPGIGPYTARAVAAIAFGVPVGAVDTNVRRVLRRMTGAPDRASDRATQALADAVVSRDRPADWTHAVMDVGATFCQSTRPRCAACPANPWCRYAAEPAPSAVVEEPGTSPRPTAAPFHRTSRWLRGRLLERLRSAEGWVAFPERIADHAPNAVRAALGQMAKEGLVELDSAEPSVLRARLPLG
jgi:A/G-specific adenine glycosylase